MHHLITGQIVSQHCCLNRGAALTAICVLLSLAGVAQDKDAARLYNTAVEKYNAGEFKAAEGYFTKSIKLAGDRDTYFSRGLCRGKLADQRGFCEDMAYAAVAGHAKARQMFIKGCGTIDSSLADMRDPALKNVQETQYTFTCKDTAYHFEGHHYHQKFSSRYDSIVRANVLEADTASPLTGPEYPGGLNEARRFVGTHLVYPQRCREDGMAGKVHVHFDIYEDGTLRNISALDGVPGCPEFSYEACKVIAMMPRWNAAKRGKKLVKSEYTMPVTFHIAE